MNKTITLTAQGISYLFHPLVIPSLGFLLLFNSGFYFSMLSGQVKNFILLVVVFTTFVLPLLTMGLLVMNSRISLSMEKSTERVVPLLFCSVYYYIGYYLLGQLPIYPIYKFFLVSTILLIALLMVISMRWKISNHMASIGGLTGAFLALSLRLQINTSLWIALIVLIAGLVGTSRLILKKHDALQVYAGYGLGFLVMFLIMMII